MDKLARFEIKPMDVRFVFSMERHERIVEVQVDEGRRKFKAHASAADFYRAVEMTLNRLSRQLSKDKSRVKAHKNQENSAYGKLSRIGDELEPIVDAVSGADAAGDADKIAS
jgi:ribosomal subunit interface protein